MIKRSAEKSIMRVENFKGGGGEYVMHHIAGSPEELYGKGRIFGHSVLNKGCGVGWHLHEGEGEYNDNGAVSAVSAGDVCFTADGEGHALKNHKDEPLEFIALVIYN